MANEVTHLRADGSAPIGFLVPVPDGMSLGRGFRYRPAAITAQPHVCPKIPKNHRLRGRDPNSRGGKGRGFAGPLPYFPLIYTTSLPM